MYYRYIAIMLCAFLRVIKYYKYLQSINGFLRDGLSYFAYAASSQICSATTSFVIQNRRLTLWFDVSTWVSNRIIILSFGNCSFRFFPLSVIDVTVHIFSKTESSETNYCLFSLIYTLFQATTKFC